MGSADFYGQQRPMYRGQGAPLFGMAGGGGMPRLDDPYAIMHIGAPGDVVYRLTEAASQPGHPLYHECLQQGIPPGLIYDYIMQEKEMADQQGVPCRWDQVLERVGGLDVGGAAQYGGYAGGYRQSGRGHGGGSAWTGGPRGQPRGRGARNQGPRGGGRGPRDSHRPPETESGDPRRPDLTQRQKQARDERRHYKNGIDAKIAFEGGLG
ncbi:MAG: hypothetical protein Q9188_002524 [Gyalolechia gomerana]